jgi:hypothetical protein
MGSDAPEARWRRTARVCPHCGSQDPTLGTNCPVCGRPFEPRSLADSIPTPDGDGAGAFAFPALVALVGWLLYAAIVRPVVLTVLLSGLAVVLVLGVGWQILRARADRRGGSDGS